jgi:hypothetical protein
MFRTTFVLSLAKEIERTNEQRLFYFRFRQPVLNKLLMMIFGNPPLFFVPENQVRR